MPWGTQISVTPGFPIVTVPVLSNAITSTLPNDSRWTPPLNSTPCRPARAIAESGLHASHVTLELTESILFADDPVVNARLHELRALGVRIAIDDFGTGYSSLSYLSKFPIDTVKIDQSFVSGIGRGQRRNATIVYATIELAHALGLSVVAEGVEHPEELSELRKAGCDAAQGFLLGRPTAFDCTYH